MAVETFAALSDMLLKSYTADFIQQMTNPSSLYNLMKKDTNPIPEEIRCSECEGAITYSAIITVPCSTCYGKGVPPIPVTEYLTTKRSSKAKNDLTQKIVVGKSFTFSQS